MLTLLLIVILAALIFDFINGFHDAANAIATTVATGALSLGAAVTLSAIFNFVGAMGGEEVAKYFAKDFLAKGQVASQYMVLAALIGASAWNLLTWWWGLPSSSSHALVGGLVGAVLVDLGPVGVHWHNLLMKPVLWLVLSPLIGFVVAFLAMVGLTWLLARARPARVNRGARRWQLLSACAFSYSHGLNDAQKVMGIITLSLIAYMTAVPAGERELAAWMLPDEATKGVPLWVKIACALAIALGTLAGGKRIIKTMGSKVARIQPLQGFTAQTAGTGTLMMTGYFGIPVSTTHAINASILGAGSAWRLTAVRWGVVGNIMAAWVFTLPASALMAALALWAMHLCGIGTS